MNSIAVLMCIWQRPERLRETLDMLTHQTVQDIDLYLINNNPALDDFVADAVHDAKMPIYVNYKSKNAGMFARFEMAHKLARVGSGYEYYVIIDDDYVFPADYIEQVKHEARLDAIVGVWVHNFNGGNYWNKTPVAIGDKGDMAGASGIVMPREFVRCPRILEIPKERVNIDDIWVSYCVYLFGLPILRGNFHGCSTVKDGKDTWRSIKGEKEDFLTQLRAAGWKV